MNKTPTSGPSQNTVFLFAHDVEPSGAPRVTVDVARMLLAGGVNGTLVFPASGGLEAQARGEGLPTMVIPNPPESFASAPLGRKFTLLWQRLSAVRECVRLARNLPQKPLFWVGSTVLPEVVLAAWVAGCPAVVHVHENIPPRGEINTLKVRFLSRFAQRLVFVTAPTMKPFLPFAPRSKCVVIPNRVEPRFFSPPPRSLAFREALGASEADQVFLSTGFLSHRKGFDLLLTAFAVVHKRFPATKLWIAGTDPDAKGPYEAALRQQAAQLGLDSAVRFLGYRGDAEALLANADCFVLASRNEALPLSLIEAMIVGCPVVSTDVGGVSEMVLNNETGLLVPPEKPSELAEAMIKMLTQPKEKSAKSAQTLAIERFQPQTITRQCVELAQDVLLSSKQR